MIIPGWQHFANQMQRGGWIVKSFLRDGIVIAVCEHDDPQKNRTYVNSHGMQYPLVIKGLPVDTSTYERISH